MKNLLLNEGYKIGDYYYGGNGSFIKDKKILTLIYAVEVAVYFLVIIILLLRVL